METTTGSEALLYCQQTPPPDLVILDLKLTLRHDAKDEALTKVSGLELAHRFPHGLPFIVLTADRSRDTLRAACAAGAWSYCVKPPDADNLLATIEMALAHAQARQHLEWALSDSCFSHSDRGVQPMTAPAEKPLDRAAGFICAGTDATVKVIKRPWRMFLHQPGPDHNHLIKR
ncbi:MAG: hypothetical protein H6969_06850 [Gammaproteobacteria bacterium]|nr:hypothetical protein [Gammaproteobacteria bacterium]